MNDGHGVPAGSLDSAARPGPPLCVALEVDRLFPGHDHVGQREHGVGSRTQQVAEDRAHPRPGGDHHPAGAHPPDGGVQHDVVASELEALHGTLLVHRHAQLRRHVQGGQHGPGGVDRATVGMEHGHAVTPQPRPPRGHLVRGQDLVIEADGREVGGNGTDLGGVPVVEFPQLRAHGHARGRLQLVPQRQGGPGHRHVVGIRIRQPKDPGAAVGTPMGMASVELLEQVDVAASQRHAPRRARAHDATTDDRNVDVGAHVSSSLAVRLVVRPVVRGLDPMARPDVDTARWPRSTQGEPGRWLSSAGSGSGARSSAASD